MTHPNSIKAYREERPRLSTRASDILEHFRSGAALTDRAVKEAMWYDDMNTVRPRITELVQAGYLREAGKTKCPVTGKTVRVVELRDKP